MSGADDGGASRGDGSLVRRDAASDVNPMACERLAPGAFEPPAITTAGGVPASMWAVDPNGEGYLDLAAGNKTEHVVTVLIGNGDGAFRPAAKYAVTGNAISLASGDLNGGFLNLLQHLQ